MLQEALEARGLRGVLESTLLDVMYEVPGNSDVQKVVVTKAAIERTGTPLLIGKNGETIPWGSGGKLDAAA